VEFKEIHKLLNTANKVRQMQAVSGKQDSNTTLGAVQKLRSKANDVIHSLNLTNKWNIPQGHRADAFGNVCYNCGTLDHSSNKCPLPRDEAKITKAKEACAKSVTDGRGSGGHGCGHGCGDGCGGHGGDHKILGESGVPIRVILLLPVQIYLWVMELKSKMESG
jgi:hypothetical protein